MVMRGRVDNLAVNCKPTVKIREMRNGGGIAAMKKTHYELLEVAETCSDEMVRLAYGHVSKTLMEKIVVGDQRASDDLWAVNAAYEVLSDPPRRKIYDEKLKQAFSDDGEAKSSRAKPDQELTGQGTKRKQGEHDAHVENAALRDVSTTKLILGVTGSSMVMLGFFLAPLVSIPMLGSANWFASGKGYGVLVLIVGLVSLILTLIRRYHGLFYTGAGILGLLIYFVFSWGAWLLLVGAILVIAAAAYGNPASAIRQSFVGDAKKVLARAKKIVGLAVVIGWAAWQPASKTLLGS